MTKKKILQSGGFFVPLFVFFCWVTVNVMNPNNIPPYSTYVLFTALFAVACVSISFILKRIFLDHKIEKINNKVLLLTFFSFYVTMLISAHFFLLATIETNFHLGYVFSYFLSSEFIRELGIMPAVRYLFYFGIKYIPIAFMFPLLFRIMRNPFIFAITLACISFGFELLQAVTRSGSSYLDDAIVGFLGGMIIYIPSLLLIKKSSKFQMFLSHNFFWFP